MKRLLVLLSTILLSTACQTSSTHENCLHVLVISIRADDICKEHGGLDQKNTKLPNKTLLGFGDYETNIVCKDGFYHEISYSGDKFDKLLEDLDERRGNK